MAAPNFAKTVKEAALTYARSEFDVFPAYVNATGGKQPFVKGWKELHVSHDPVKVEKTFESYKKATIVGWLLPENIVVIDLDMNHIEGQNGIADFQRLDGRHPDDVPTPQAKSPRGGRHLFFRKESTDTTVYRNWIGIFDSAIDVKKLWIPLPTTGIDGRAWIRMPSGPEDFAPIPDWVKQVPQDQPFAGQTKSFLGHTPWAEQKLEYLCAKVEHAPEGSRDKTLWGVAKTIGGYIAGGVFEDVWQTRQVLLDAAMKMDPPLMSEHELAQKIKRGVIEGMKHPLNMPEEKKNLGYIVNKDGHLLSILPNITHSLKQVSELVGLFRWDEFGLNVTVTRAVPDPYQQSKDKFPRILNDNDETKTNNFLQRFGMLNIKPTILHAAIIDAAVDNSFHPVRDYLSSRIVEGPDPLNTWIHDYLGAEQNEYTAAVGRMFIISMVARIFEPGCKVDYVLILEGEQGKIKSTALATLASAPWFSDDLPDIHTKDAKVHLSGKWLIEIAELHRMQRADKDAYKAYITRATDKYRPPYGRNEIDQPRQCVFAATTNQEEYFTDETGNRRGWPIRCGVLDIEGLKKARDQLFAHAVDRYHHGEQWWPDKKFEAMYIEPEQHARLEMGALAETLQDVLWTFEYHPSLKEIVQALKPNISYTDLEKLDKNLHRVMTKLGWIRTNKQNDQRQRTWKPGPKAATKPEAKPHRKDQEDIPF